MSSLSIDFETRATVDLRATGVYPYAQHKDTGIWCMAWAFDDEEPEVWYPPTVAEVLGLKLAFPERIIDHIEAGGELRAWNAQFERVIWHHVLPRVIGTGWMIQPKMEQWVCSAAEAAAMALPRSLDYAAQVLGVAQKKDTEGYQLMLRMTRPRSVKDGNIVWWDVAERIHRLGSYCAQDVRTERSVVKALRRLGEKERQVYLLDQRMNDRGIQLDVPLVNAAKAIVAEGVDRANLALQEVTGGEVTEVTKVGQLKDWLAEQGVEAPSLAKKAVRDLLESDLSPEARAVIELRAEAGRSSVAKLDSMLEVMCEDGRLRGLMLYHGASTGRWAGKLVQPHNFPRPDLPKPNPKMSDEEYVAWLELFIPDVLAGRYDILDLFFPPIQVIVNLLRAMLTAREGYELIAADYAAIEARIVNWLAGQEDILALFAAGEDVYSYNAGRLPGAEPYVKGKKHPWRQTGKFQELGCGFGMGAKKAVSAAKEVYGLTITPEEAKMIVDGYRSTHPKVVDFWREADQACIEAVENPGKVIVFGAQRNLKAVKAGSYLYIILPSRRPLCYAAPKVVMAPMPWNPEDLRPAVEFSGVDPFTKKWGRLRLYGGLIVENIVQAVARDWMAEAMLRVDTSVNSPYLPILSVHDEVVAEVPLGLGSVEEFETLLATAPEWGIGCPIAAEGWRGFRYRK